jgi:hypothetical protein
MTQIVVQHFELKGIPQACPRAAEHPIDKLAPQLTKGGFNLLPDMAENEAMSGGLVTSDQPHVRFFRQIRCTVGTPRAQITQGDPPRQALNQSQGRETIIAIPRRQDNIEDASVNMAEQMELEPKEPPFTAFPKVRTFIPHQANPPMADGQAEGDGFAINQIQVGGVIGLGTGSEQQSTDLGQQVVHPRQPLFVGGQMAKRGLPVLRHQPIGLFERGNFTYPLQQGNRQHFGIAKLRLGVRRVPPLSQLRVGFEEVVHNTIEFDHLMLYACTHRSSPPGNRIKARTSILLFR